MQSVLGFFLRKNNTSSLLLGLYHASVNRISIVLMQITPQNRLHYGIVQVENEENPPEPESIFYISLESCRFSCL